MLQSGNGRVKSHNLATSQRKRGKGSLTHWQADEVAEAAGKEENQWQAAPTGGHGVRDAVQAMPQKSIFLAWPKGVGANAM